MFFSAIEVHIIAQIHLTRVAIFCDIQVLIFLSVRNIPGELCPLS
jgi:hypothetical protein